MRHPEPAHTEGMIAVHTSCDAGDFPCRRAPLAVQGPSGIGSQTVDIAMGLVYAHYEHRFFIAESEIVIVDMSPDDILVFAPKICRFRSRKANILRRELSS